MPLYRCAVPRGTTTTDQRAEIARAVVRIHCGVTGAPPSFVHAFFQETEPGELPAGKVALVLGTIRWGRTDAQKAEIRTTLCAAVAQTLGTTPDAVDVMTADVPSRWNMEGGALLPEPGEEAAWLAEHGR